MRSSSFFPLLTNYFFKSILSSNETKDAVMLTTPLLQVVRRTAQAANLLGHPLRLKLLERLQEQPDSASGLARKLELPRQVLNYHLKALEAAEFIEFAEERPRRGLKERVMRATAQAYLISPEALGPIQPDPSRLRDRFSWAYLVAAAAKIIRDLGILRARADRAGQRLATFTLETDVRFASAADRDAFTRELSEYVTALAVKYHDERAKTGRVFRFVLGAYPAITKTDQEAELTDPKPATELKP
jgi:DNA-binding transcriptional ArsR family regulator